MKLPAILITLLLTICVLSSSARADKAPPDVILSGHANLVLDVAFSPDGKLLASVGDDGTLKVWDLSEKKERFTATDLHTNQNRACFTPDGKRIVALASDGTVAVFDVQTGKVDKAIRVADLVGGPSAFDLSPDGKTLAVVGRGSLRLIDLDSGTAKASYEVHPSYGIGAVAFSPDGGMLATVSTDNTAVLTSAATGQLIRTLKLGLNGVAVVFSGDGKTVFASSTDKVLRSFDAASGTEKKVVDKTVPIFSLCVSKDGKTLVLGGPAHGPWLVSLPDGSLIEPAYDAEDWVRSAAISPDGKWLAGGANGGAIYLWKTGN